MITEIREDKKRYLDLLLLGDEQESMIDKYLERGQMFALFEEDLKAVCVVTKGENSICELKNLAVYPRYQGMGYGKALVEFIAAYCASRCAVLLVGTGDSPLTLPFYLKCGFSESYRVRNFFTDHYDYPIFEAGKQLVDLVYLSRNL